MTPRPVLTVCTVLCAGMVLTGCLQAPHPGHQHRDRGRFGAHFAPPRPAVARAAGSDAAARVQRPAAPPSDETVSLEAAQLVCLALARDPGLTVARAEVGLALARLALAGLPDDPQLRTGISRNQTSYVVDEQMMSDGYSRYAVGIRVFPVHPWARRAEHQREAALARAAEEALKEAEARVREAVRQAMTLLRQSDEEVSWHLRRMAAIRGRVGWLAEMADEGRATADQSALAELASFQSRRAHAVAVLERDHRAQHLGGLTGVAPERLLALVQAGGLDRDLLADHAGDVDSTASDVRATRGAVHRARVEAAEAGLRLHRARRIPWFSHLQATFEDDNRDGRRDAWTLQCAVDLPLRARFERQLRGAEAEYRLALAEWAAAESRDELRLVAAREALSHALDHARSVEEESLPLIDKLRRTRDELDAGGVAGREARLRMEEAILDAEHAAMQARFAVERARDAWAAALGAE